MSSGNSVKVGRLFYTFPVGDSLTVVAGPIVRTDDASMYAGYATYYPSDLLLRLLHLRRCLGCQQPGLHWLWCWCCLHPG